ncbi:MAG: hypothetical protein HWN51_05300 [Desulfobacterales bacterium]|nr:hypothetical protein [Desulfobacterales bacterium]
MGTKRAIGLICTCIALAGGVVIMALDHPDWWMEELPTVYPLTADLAEHAARVRSPVAFDRRGNVVFLSRFAHGTGQFELKPVGNKATLALTPDTFLSGPFSLKMVTSDVSNEVSTASALIAIPNSTTWLGSETGVAFTDVEVGFALQISAYMKPTLYQWTLVYRTDQDRLFIVSPTGAGILDDSLVLHAGKQVWHRMKLVIDLENKEYIRVLLDEDEWDVSDYAAYEYPTSEPRRIDIRLQGYCRDNTNRDIQWDDVIVTQNEP